MKINVNCNKKRGIANASLVVQLHAKDIPLTSSLNDAVLKRDEVKMNFVLKMTKWSGFQLQTLQTEV